jgi:photosystem II stability/assembly factor-like uncharacterized protein
MGPLGGDVRSLAADPILPNVLYLGTADGFVFGSRDAGEHWQSLGQVASGVITAIVISPPASETLFAAIWTAEANGEGGGVFVSRDLGRTWQETGLVGHAVRALVRAPSDRNVLVAGALDGVFRSNDQGKNWERITPSADSELRNFDSLAIDPQNPDVIYAGTFHLPWKTVDGGENWTPIHGGMIDDSDVLSLEVDASNPHRIFAGACSGIYRSENAGTSWRKIEGIPYSARRTLVIRRDPRNPETLFAGTTEGLWKTVDGGTRWQRISPKDWVINSLVVQPAVQISARDDVARSSEAGPRVVVGTEQRGVLASDDGGDHFRALNEGFHHRRIVSLATDAEKPGAIAAVLANSPEPLVETDDGGRTWSAMDAGLNGNPVARIFSSSVGWIAALGFGGLARFDTQKGKWSQLGNAGAFHFVVNDMAFAEASWVAASADGLFVTYDDGNTWAALPFGNGNLPVDSVRVSSDSQRLRIVSSNAMVFSDDAGKTWSWRDLPLDSGGARRLEFADGDTLLALARNGLYISRDGGTAWRRLQTGLPSATPVDLLIGPGFWLVSMRGRGLFLSQNKGSSWSRVIDPGETNLPLGLTIMKNGMNDEVVYAGSADDGLYLLNMLRDRTPNPLESVSGRK